MRDLIVLDADLAGGYQDRYFPERISGALHWDCGIAEEQYDRCGSRIGGMQEKFRLPVLLLCLQRDVAYEQVRNSIGYPHLNVKIGATHAGISVGEDGATHQCNGGYCSDA